MTITIDEDPIDLLVFELEGRRFGLPAEAVDELVHAVAQTPLPGEAGGDFEGVVDVRGGIVPVMDIRRRLGMGAKAVAPSDHLIIARAGGRRVAVRVDRTLELSRSPWQARGTGGRVAGLARHATYGIVPVLSLEPATAQGRGARP